MMEMENVESHAKTPKFQKNSITDKGSTSNSSKDKKLEEACNNSSFSSDGAGSGTKNKGKVSPISTENTETDYLPNFVSHKRDPETKIESNRTSKEIKDKKKT